MFIQKVRGNIMINKIVKIIVKAVVFAFYKIFFRVKFEGLENIPKFEAGIIAPNHISNFDPPLMYIMTKRDMNIMSKASLLKVPVFGRFLKYMGIYAVERNRKDMGAVKKSLTFLKQGNLLCVFPEGTRNGVEKGQKLHNGVAFLSIAGKVPVIPVGISGEYKLFHKVTVKIGKPIYFKEYYNVKNVKEKYEEINEVIWADIQNLIKNVD